MPTAEQTFLDAGRVASLRYRLVQAEHMGKTIRKYAGMALDEIKADEYRCWQSRSVHERVDAVRTNSGFVRAEGRGPGCTPTSKNSCSF